VIDASESAIGIGEDTELAFRLKEIALLSKLDLFTDVSTTKTRAFSRP
jgi:hypothetical protein